MRRVPSEELRVKGSGSPKRCCCQGSVLRALLATAPSELLEGPTWLLRECQDKEGLHTKLQNNTMYRKSPTSSHLSLRDAP
jgi:hypothetical protein